MNNSFTLTETVDADMILKCLQSPKLNQEHANKLASYYCLVKANGGEVKVTYKQKVLGDRPMGRYYAQGKILYGGQQWKHLRSSLYGTTETDIDAVNCHPTILLSIAETFDLPCNYLKGYCLNRDKYIKNLDITQTDIDNYNRIERDGSSLKDLGKQVFTAAMFGAGIKKVQDTLHMDRSPIRDNSIADCLLKEIKQLCKSVVALEDFSFYRHCLPKGSSPGKILSYILCDYETDAVLDLMEAFKRAGIEPSMYIYDGFQVKSQDYELIDKILEETTNTCGLTFIRKPFPETLDQVQVADVRSPVEISQHIDSLKTPENGVPVSALEYNDPGYYDPIVFMSIVDTKPVQSTGRDGKVSVVYISSDEEIVQKKAYFEKYVSYIKQLNSIAYKSGTDVWVLASVSKCMNLFANISYTCLGAGGTPMPSNWFKYWILQVDRQMHEYVQWIPYTKHAIQVPPSCLNTFCGFMHKYDPDFEVDQEKVKPWLTHLEDVWSSGDQVIYKYLLGWFASLVQKPHEKIGVNLVLKSVREGAGKNIMTDFMLHNVLGDRFGSSYSNIDALLQKHNAGAEKHILSVLDEVGEGGKAFKYHNQIKDMTTRIRVTVEPKGVDRYTAPDYNNYIFTSNEDWIIKISDSDRRNLCLDISCHRIDQPEYWANLLAYKNNDVGEHFFQYLLAYNLDEFNPRSIPVTEWKRQLRARSYSPEIQALMTLKDETKVHSQELMNIYNGFIGEKTRFRNVQSFNSHWGKYTGWELVARLRVGARQGAGFQLKDGLVLDTIRRITKDSTWEFPEDDGERDEGLPDDCLLPPD